MLFLRLISVCLVVLLSFFPFISVKAEDMLTFDYTKSKFSDMSTYSEYDDIISYLNENNLDYIVIYDKFYNYRAYNFYIFYANTLQNLSIKYDGTHLTLYNPSSQPVVYFNGGLWEGQTSGSYTYSYLKSNIDRFISGKNSFIQALQSEKYLTALDFDPITFYKIPFAISDERVAMDLEDNNLSVVYDDGSFNESNINAHNFFYNNHYSDEIIYPSEESNDIADIKQSLNAILYIIFIVFIFLVFLFAYRFIKSILPI